MASSTFVLLSSALSFGVPLLWALHELVSLRRDPGGYGGPGHWRPDGPSTPPEPRGGAREYPHPLPACLVEAARGAPAACPKVPELESA